MLNDAAICHRIYVSFMTFCPGCALSETSFFMLCSQRLELLSDLSRFQFFMCATSKSDGIKVKSGNKTSTEAVKRKLDKKTKHEMKYSWLQIFG